MPIPARPIVTAPNSGESFSSNIGTHRLHGTCANNTLQILVNSLLTNVTYIAGATTWYYDATGLPQGPNILNVIARNTFGDSPPAVQIINVLNAESLNIQVTSPTGISVQRKESTLLVSWVKNPEAQVTGYNVYFSDQPAGGSAGYTRLSKDLISVAADTERQYTEPVEDQTEDGGVRTTITTEDYTDVDIFEYELTQLPDGSPLVVGQNYYFVVTAVAFDDDTQQEVESVYSSEVFGSLINLRPQINDISPRTEQDIQSELIKQILDGQPDLDITPNSYTRDVVIDPVPTEVVNLYTVLDFVSRAQGWVTLQEYDDADGDGISDPVESSAKKQKLRDALGLDDTSVQTLIDSQFDKKAADTGTIRQSASKAVGYVTFYRESAPTTDSIVPKGSIISTQAEDGVTASQFETTVEGIIEVSSLAVYWNQAERRYEVTVQVRALVEGSSGNVPAGSITQNASVTGLKVTNKLAIVYGREQESNFDLRLRAQLDMVGLDTGSKNGILKTVLAQKNVMRSVIVASGDDQMYRDWDSARLMHVGGKSDVYLVGGVMEQVQDKFAFWYPTISDERVTIENIQSLRFRVTNANVTPDTPIFQVLQVMNLTRGLPYILTGYNVDTDGDIIQLNALDAGNIAIGLAQSDVIVATYRYKPEHRHEFSRQPLKSIVSIVGDLSGALDLNYDIYKTADPMLLGNSIYADDSMRLFPTNVIEDESVVLNGLISKNLVWFGVKVGTIEVWNQAKTILYTEAVDFTVVYGNISTATSIVRTIGTTIPGGATVLVTYETRLPVLPLNQVQSIVDESVTLDGIETKDLLKYGVLEGTIVVKSQIGQVYTAGKDYVEVLGDSEVKTTIRRSGIHSTIMDGETVLISYDCGENITVTYLTNDLIQQVETVLNGTTSEGFSHATNNIVVKEAFEILSDIVVNITVATNVELTRAEIKKAVATSISKQFSAKLLGQGIGQSDVIAAVDNTFGVDRVRVPIAKLVRQDYSPVVRRDIWSKFISYQQALVQSWITTPTIIDESVILNGTTPEDLLYHDPQEGTPLVTDSTGVTTYAEDVDYVIIYSGRDTASQIYRISTGSIVDGSTVLVSYTTSEALEFNTLDNGGARVQIGSGFGWWYHPVGIVQDDQIALTTVFSATDVAQGAGRVFIRSDGRVIISTPDGSDPSTHSYAVTYLTYGETGAKDLGTMSLEYLRVGAIACNVLN